jgi:hypothetical protein
MEKGAEVNEQKAKAPWEPISMTYIGHVGDVLQAGGGKISSPPADPGDTPFKPPGQTGIDTG